LRVKLTEVESQKPGRPEVSRLDVVERAEAYARAHAGAPVSVSTLCLRLIADALQFDHAHAILWRTAGNTACPAPMTMVS
jgi:hypothetical protein